MTTGRAAGDPAVRPARGGVQGADRGQPPWFIGSVVEGPGCRRVMLRGDIGAVAADRLDGYLRDILDTCVRHIVVDATEVRRCDPLVVEVLAHTQDQLSARRGLLTVVGLPPSLYLIAEADLRFTGAQRGDPGPSHAPSIGGRAGRGEGPAGRIEPASGLR